MKRMKVMFGQRRIMVLATLAILVLAAAALAASSASFTATSANPNNVFTAGALYISNEDTDGNSREGVQVLNLTASAMQPGDVVTGTAVIGNSGTSSGAFTLDSTTSGHAAFASYLDLVVTEDGNEIYNGSFDGLTTAIALDQTGAGDGSFAASEQHEYVFTVTFPDGGTGADNAYMGAQSTLALAWAAVSN